MEALSQFDLAHPDHVSVHIRSGNILVSVKKDGGTWNLEMPLASNDRKVFDTAPAQTRIPTTTKPTVLQQTTTVVTEKPTKTLTGFPTPKLTESQVKDIKNILASSDLMTKFKTKANAFKQLGSIYNVSADAIRHIYEGKSWARVKPDDVNHVTEFEKQLFHQFDKAYERKVKPQSVVRIDRTEDGKQIEKRSVYRTEYNGSQPFTSKLTEKQVREIRTILADKQLMSTYNSDYKAYKDLAEAYGVSYMTIQFIHKNVTWKHVKV